MANINFDDTYTEDEYIRAIQADFTRRAPEYNFGESGEQHRQIIQVLLQTYPPQFPLLDVACGTGLLAEQLGRQGEGVTGLDVTEAMLQQARLLSPKGTFVRGRAEKLPFDDCSFASVYVCSAIVYFTDIPAVVKEIYRVLNHGGLFAYQAVTLDSYVVGVQLQRAVRQVLGEQRAKDVFELPHGITHDERANRKLMNDAGFVDVQTKMNVRRESLDVAKLERFWDAVVGRNALMGKLRALSLHENQAIRDRWVQLTEERRNAEGVVPDTIESWPSVAVCIQRINNLMVPNPDDQTPSKENGADSQTLILITFENVCLVNEAEHQTPPGTLSITQEALRWESESAPSWTVNFADINLHAISTDASSGYPPSIYAQTGDDYKEIRMIPEESRLQELYNALCEGVVRNEDSTSEDMGILSMGEDTNDQR